MTPLIDQTGAYLADDASTATDPLGRTVARLISALERLAGSRVDGTGRTGLAFLARRLGLASADSLGPALDSAVASGFVGRSGNLVWLTRLGLSLSAPPGPDVESEAEGSGLEDATLEVARVGSMLVGAEELAARLGLDVDDAWEALGLAEALGQVSRWPDDPRGPSAALAPSSADRLGLVATSDGERWIRKGTVDPTIRRARTAGPSVEDEGDDFDPFASAEDMRHPGGLEQAMLDEMAAAHVSAREWDIRQANDRAGRDAADAENRKLAGRHRSEKAALARSTWRLKAPERRRLLAELEAKQKAERWAEVSGRMARSSAETATVRGLPAAVLLVGLGIPWPAMAEGSPEPRRWTPADGPCPGCRGGSLGLTACCLVCHRSGLDGLLPPVEPSMMPRPERAGSKARPKGKGGALKGGVGRATA